MTSCLPTAARSSRSSSRRPRGALALLGLWLASSPAFAHDHWIAPSSFRPALGERVELDLCVGHPQEFERQPRDPRRAVRFEGFGPDGRAEAVLGLDGKPPGGLFKAKAPGAYLFAYQSQPAFIEIEPVKYAEYLRMEGLEDIQAERERAGETAKPGRDSYARFDKALVLVPGAEGAASGFERVVGLPLELVLESDPRAWKDGDALALRLLFESRPLANRQVKLLRLEAPFLTVLARTDAEGRARLAVPSPGPWAAFAVHQRRARPEQGLEGDWEGFWASFSFELDPAASAASR